VTPDALQSRSIQSAELSPDGACVILRFEDDGPAVSVGPVAKDTTSPDEEEGRFSNALATSESEPGREMDDPQSLLGRFLERGFKKVSKAGYAEARRALRVELEDEAGATRPLYLFCAETYDGAQVSSFDRLGLTTAY